MKNKMVLFLRCLLFFLIAFFPKQVFSDYIEGIDTTDAGGYGLDSAFSVTNGYISGQNIAHYCFYEPGARGYFNYSFDDIKMSPDSSRQNMPFGMNRGDVYYCFLIKKNKDSTCSKVQLISHLSGNRYIYRYGTNTIPNDRLLTKSDYDRSIRYKPNNLFNNPSNYPSPADRDTLYWDPPILSNNNLLGYIFYRSKPGFVIDTTVPINPTQWDSIAFFTSTKVYFPEFITNGYVNFVAVYAEGKSDFLLGWTKSAYSLVGVKYYISSLNNIEDGITIKKASNGFFLSFQSLISPHSGPVMLSIYDMAGRQVARFSRIKNNTIILNPLQRDLVEGLYVVKAELPDKSILIQKFMFLR